MCEHKRLVCTDNVFTCKDCGAVLPAPGQDDEIPVRTKDEMPVRTKNAQEGPQKAAKRKAKKEGK